MRVRVHACTCTCTCTQGGLLVGDEVRVGERLRFMVRDARGAREDLQAQGMRWKRAQLQAALGLGLGSEPTAATTTTSSTSSNSPTASASSSPSSPSVADTALPAAPSPQSEGSSPGTDQQGGKDSPAEPSSAVPVPSPSPSIKLVPSKPPGPPFGMLMFTCNGRGSALYEEDSYDARTVSEFIPVPVAGFQCNGARWGDGGVMGEWRDGGVMEE